MSNAETKLELKVKLDKIGYSTGDTINVSAYIINRSPDPVTILRSRVVPSFESSNWKRNAMNTTVYNGPATSIIAPGDSAYFGYQLNDFFDSIPPGQSTLTIKLNVLLEGSNNPVVLSDQVNIEIKNKE